MLQKGGGGGLQKCSPGETAVHSEGHRRLSELKVGSDSEIMLEKSVEDCDTTMLRSIKNGDIGVKSMEENLEELEALAKTLRQSKVLALPTLLWGTSSDGSADSEESVAIRYYLTFLEQFF